MSRAQIIKDYENLRELEEYKKDLDRQLIRLCAEIEKIEDRVNVAQSVKAVYRGVPITIDKYGTSVDFSEAAKDWRQRTAHVYRNANRPKYYGLEVSAYDEHGNRKSQNRGFGWPTKKLAMLAGQEWVVSGKLPKMNGKS